MRETDVLMEPILSRSANTGNVEFDRMIRYALPLGRPRFRAVLVRLGAEAAGGTLRQAVPVAVAVELLHIASLLLDDLFDRAPQRHGRRAVHIRWSADSAVLVAAFLKSHAASRVLVSARSQTRGCIDLAVRASDTLEEAWQRMLICEHLDLRHEALRTVSVSDYEARSEGTVAALMQASLQLGSIWVGGSQSESVSLGVYGRHLGLAFQIRNDLADLYGDEAEMGRPVGRQFRE